MLHQHKFCDYKGKRKLKLPITCENFVLFALYQFLFCFVNIFVRKCGKKVYSHGGRLERVGRVTANTAFFAFNGSSHNQQFVSWVYLYPITVAAEESGSFRPLSRSPLSRFAHFPFRPESFRPRVVSPTFPFAPESFRPFFCWPRSRFALFIKFYF